MTTKTADEIMGEIPEAAREEAERLVTARVFDSLRCTAFMAQPVRDPMSAASLAWYESGWWRHTCSHRVAGALAVCAKLEAK